MNMIAAFCTTSTTCVLGELPHMHPHSKIAYAKQSSTSFPCFPGRRAIIAFLKLRRRGRGPELGDRGDRGSELGDRGDRGDRGAEPVDCGI